MFLVLDIPEVERIPLIKERTKNRQERKVQNAAKTIDRKIVLTATPCPYLNADGTIDESLLALELVEIIQKDRATGCFGPHGLDKENSNKEYKRSEAREWIGRENDKGILKTLNEDFGIRNLLRGGEGKFTAHGLLPIGTRNTSCEDSMLGLARQIEPISKTVRSGVPQEQDKWCTAILDFAEGATQCKNMEYFAYISVSLFSAVVRLWELIRKFLSSTDKKLVKDIAGKYLRNYVAVVLLAESMSDGSED